MIKALSRGKVSKTIRAHILETKKAIEKKHSMYIQISPKVDSGNQRRVQCRIRSIAELMNMLPSNFTVSDDAVRGVKITTVISSGKRTRFSKRTSSSA
jgi:hypothetical protein